MKITQSELQDYLLKATGLIRGSNNAYEVKEYIFAMLFLKRCNDTFHARQEEIIKEQLLNGTSQKEAEEIAENKMSYRSLFFVPPTSRWNYLVNQAHKNIGNYLNEALGGLEKCNCSLKGIFSSIDFNRKIYGGSENDSSLRELIHHFNALNLSDRNKEAQELLHKAYEYLISVFAKTAGKKGGEFFTPRSVTKLMAGIIKPNETHRVYDPCCGSGGMFIASKEYIELHGGDGRALACYGQDINRTTWSLARMNMLLHGLSNCTLEQKDSLYHSQHAVCDGEVIKFDRILSNPPFSMKYDQTSSGPRIADLVFIQHMIDACSDEGKVATITSLGALFRGGEELNIRKSIINDDLLEAVISLPANLFYGTAIPAALLIFNKNKDVAKRNKTIFIDASHDFLKDKNINRLREEDLSKITRAYYEFKDLDSYAKVVDLDNIRKKNYDLTIKRYVDNSPVLKKINELNKHHQSFEEYGFSQEHPNCIVRSISTPRDTPKNNSILIRRIIAGKKDYFGHHEIDAKQRHNYFEVEFDDTIVSSIYVELFFESELGKLTLLNLPSGNYSYKLTKQDIESLTIYLPSQEEQEKILILAKKLDVAREQLAGYKRDLLTKPSLYQEVESRTDDFVYELSSLDEVSRVKQLIKINETQRIEFKQTFFVNADDLGQKFSKSDKEYKKSCKAEQYKIIKNIATFLNTDGGTLLIGVTDDSQVCGIEMEMQHIKEIKAEAYIKRLSQDIANLIGERNSKWVEYSSVEVDGKTIIVIDCKPATKPVLIPKKNRDGTIHNEPTELIIRRGTASVTLNGYELLEYTESHFKK